MDRKSGFYNTCTNNRYSVYIWKLGTSMNSLIYHNYTGIVQSCKYSQIDIFHVKNYGTLKGALM